MRVHVFIALRSSGYVQCVYRSNKMYTPTIVLVHEEIMCFPATKHIISLFTKGNETGIKMFLNKTHASRVDKKVLKQGD